MEDPEGSFYGPCKWAGGKPSAWLLGKGRSRQFFSPAFRVLAMRKLQITLQFTPEEWKEFRSTPYLEGMVLFPDRVFGEFMKNVLTYKTPEAQEKGRPVFTSLQ